MKNMYILMAMLMTGFALAQDPAPVVLDVAPDGSAATVGVDLLAGTNAEGKREQSWSKAVLAGVSKHKWKIIGGVITAVAVDQLVLKEHELLWYEEDSKSNSKETATDEKPAPAVPGANSPTQTVGGDSDQETTVINVTGDGNTVTIDNSRPAQ